jgi:hypothetical protein
MRGPTLGALASSGLLPVFTFVIVEIANGTAQDWS